MNLRLALLIQAVILFLSPVPLRTAYAQTQPPTEPASRYTDPNGNLDWRKVFDRNADPGLPTGYITPADQAVLTQYLFWFLNNQPPIVPPTPSGACCSGSTCTVTTQIGCAGAGGTYKGDGSSCSPNPCQVVTPPGVGWTDLTLPAGARQVFVSFSTGSDSNSGLDANHPVKNLVAGVGLLRDGTADQMLLKKGDTWSNQVLTGPQGIWALSGPATGGRMVIGSYGAGARPKIVPPPGSFALEISGRFCRGHLAIVGIHIQPAATNEFNDRAFNIFDWDGTGAPIGTIKDLLIEDVRVTKCYSFGDFQSLDGFTVRRCIFEDLCTRGVTQSSNELYVNFSKNILLEENYVVNRQLGVLRECYERDSFFYVNDENPGPATVRRNVCVNKGPYGPLGIGARTHATIDDNVIDGAYMGMSIGGQDTPPSGMFPNGTHYHVGGNVILFVAIPRHTNRARAPHPRLHLHLVDRVARFLA